MNETETVSVYSTFDTCTSTIVSQDVGCTYSNVLIYLPKIYFILEIFIVFWCFKQIVLFLWTIFKEYIF